MTKTAVATHEMPEQSFPFRVTFLRDGVVLDTFVVSEPGALNVPGFGPGCTVVMEFADGDCVAYREPEL